ncbi:unnamed protein product [Trichobilharzia regenti]|nr:unnamed protein product [Trichobilharzia regenti]
MMLSRFTNHRGTPREVYSDRGTNFVGADRELQQVVPQLDSDCMMRAMTNRGIEWKLNPPYASHRGGVRERLIRSLRRVLSAVSKEQVLTDESLMTYLTEVERILNSRPLVPVYDDPSQLDVLTPNHILLSRNPEQVPEIDVSLCGRYSRRWK